MTRSTSTALAALLALLAAGCGSGGGSSPPPLPAATSLSFAAQPSAAVAGATLGDVIVEARDATGAPAAFPGPVTLSLASAPPGAVVDGTTTLTPTGASVAFAGLSLRTAGSHRLRVASGGLEAAGGVFDVSPGAPSPSTSTLVATPPSAEADGSTAVLLVATVRDAFGNPVAGAAVTLSSGTAAVAQPAAPTDAAGVATGSATSTSPGPAPVAARVGAAELASVVVQFISPDLDGDGVPNAADAFPEDPARFARYVTLPLERLGGAFGSATAVNDADLVVGFSGDGTGVQAVKWLVGGGAASLPVPLGTLEGNAHSAAYAVDASGAAVGEAEKGTTYVPVLWAPGAAAPAELPLGGLSPPGAAYGISEGRIVGEARGVGATVAVIWTAPDATPSVLPSLGGARSAAYGVSVAAGLAVGESTLAGGAGRAAAWSLDGASVTPLAPLPGDARSVALAIEPGGRIVGESETAAGEVRAVAWTLAAPDAPVALGAGSAAAANAGGRVAGHAGVPRGPALWDLRNPALLEGIFEDEFTFQLGQAHGLNAGDVAVGLLDAQGFVAVPVAP